MAAILLGGRLLLLTRRAPVVAIIIGEVVVVGTGVILFSSDALPISHVVCCHVCSLFLLPTLVLDLLQTDSKSVVRDGNRGGVKNILGYSNIGRVVYLLEQ
jgi:hypothetical protein